MPRPIAVIDQGTTASATRLLRLTWEERVRSGHALRVYPGGPSPDAVAAEAEAQWRALSPWERQARLEARWAADARHGRELAEREARRREGHERSLRAIGALRAAGSPGLRPRSYLVWRRGTFFRVALDVDVGPAELPWAWPVEDVFWEPNSDRRCEKRATGVTPDGEILPMSGVRMSEAMRSIDMGPRRYYPAVIKPQQTEY